MELNKHYKQEYTPMHIAEFDISRLEESANLFMEVFSMPPWNDTFESKESVIDFFRSFTCMSNFKGYQLIINNRVVGLSIGFIKPWLKNGSPRYEYFIDQFCIKPNLQRQGLGSYFMKEIEKRLKDEHIEDIVLNTEISSSAHLFYIHNGFNSIEGYCFLTKEI